MRDLLINLSERVGQKLLSSRVACGLTRRETCIRWASIIDGLDLPLAVKQDYGMSHQQLCKYEQGLNAIKPERLILLVSIYGLNGIEFFCEVFETTFTKSKTVDSERNSIEAMKLYNSIDDEKTRRIVRDLMRRLKSQ